jgi:hypothetical protein
MDHYYSLAHSCLYATALVRPHTMSDLVSSRRRPPLLDEHEGLRIGRREGGLVEGFLRPIANMKVPHHTLKAASGQTANEERSAQVGRVDAVHVAPRTSSSAIASMDGAP